MIATLRYNLLHSLWHGKHQCFTRFSDFYFSTPHPIYYPRNIRVKRMRPNCQCGRPARLNHRLFISRLETDARRKKRGALKKKKVALAVKFFCSHAYSTDLIGHIVIELVNREEKSHADWTNRYTLEK